MSYKITDREQAYLDELRAFHFDKCAPIDWKEEIRKPFSKGMSGPNEKVWLNKKRNFKKMFIAQLAGFKHFMRAYYNFRQTRAIKADRLLYQKWEESHPFAERILDGDQKTWRQAVKRYANFPDNCNIAKAYSLNVYDDATIECDVYLHSEKIIPEKIEKVTKRGKVRHYEMLKTKRFDLYEKYVYSSLNKVVNDLFAVLPCKRIFINGVLDWYEDYQPIVSAVIAREHHKQKRCPKQTFEQHQRHFVTFKKRSGFYPLGRVYSPPGLLEED